MTFEQKMALEVQVGDRVRLVGSDWADYEGKTVGDIVTVSSITSYGAIFADPVGTVGVGGLLYENPDGFAAELVTDDADVAVTYQGATVGDVLRSVLAGNSEEAIQARAEALEAYSVPDEHTPVSPQHYKFPGGEEVISISQWLTSNTGQALQYIARSSRIDGKNKGNAVEDIQKAIKFLTFELERLK